MHLKAVRAALAACYEGSSDVDFLELPRLKLHFKTGRGPNGNDRLFCVDHGNLFVSNPRDWGVAHAAVVRQITGMPHSLVLANYNFELTVLVPSINPIRPMIMVWSSEAEGGKGAIYGEE